MFNLAVGKPATEIEGVDVDGKPLQLSDYRGEVFVLDAKGMIRARGGVFDQTVDKLLEEIKQPASSQHTAGRGPKKMKLPAERQFAFAVICSRSDQFPWLVINEPGKMSHVDSRPTISNGSRTNATCAD